MRANTARYGHHRHGDPAEYRHRGCHRRQVSCLLPANVNYIANSASNGGVYYPATGTLFWNVGTLAKGAR